MRCRAWPWTTCGATSCIERRGDHPATETVPGPVAGEARRLRRRLRPPGRPLGPTAAARPARGSGASGGARRTPDPRFRAPLRPASARAPRPGTMANRDVRGAPRARPSPPGRSSIVGIRMTMPAARRARCSMSIATSSERRNPASTSTRRSARSRNPIGVVVSRVSASPGSAHRSRRTASSRASAACCWAWPRRAATVDRALFRGCREACALVSEADRGDRPSDRSGRAAIERADVGRERVVGDRQRDRGARRPDPGARTKRRTPASPGDWIIRRKSYAKVTRGQRNQRFPLPLRRGTSTVRQRCPSEAFSWVRTSDVERRATLHCCYRMSLGRIPKDRLRQRSHIDLSYGLVRILQSALRDLIGQGGEGHPAGTALSDTAYRSRCPVRPAATKRSGVS